MNRRHLIQMTDGEVAAFLGERRTAQVATFNKDRTIHLVTMWYGQLEGEIVMWTYAKSQKASNLRRAPDVAVLVEAGDRYEDLRGVSITGVAELSDDPDYVLRVGHAVMLRALAATAADPTRYEALERSAAKRVAITVQATKIVSWDHRKLAAHQ